MRSSAVEFMDPYISSWKVHRLACLEVKKIIDRIAEIFTPLESARPRCKSGLQVLCTLHHNVEKCKLLLRQCSETSKLYLAISGERIILRCERFRNSLESCLSLLQNMVEPTLAAQISQIVDYINTVAFSLDSSEDEAGRVLLALLRKDISASKVDNPDEIKAFKYAAVRLQITSPLALVIEKRSIRKLLSKICDTDPAKKKILNYLLYLVRKYGKSVKPQETESVVEETREAAEGDDDVFDLLEPPVKFNTRRLSALSSTSSVPSFNSSLQDLNLQVDNVSFGSLDTNSLGYVSDAGTLDGSGQIHEKSDRFKCHPSTDNGTNLYILANLSALPWLSRRKAVEEVIDGLTDYQGSHGFISTSYIKPVFRFLKEARRLGDSVAKKHGSELLLMFLKECRTDVPPLPKDAIYDLSLLLDSDSVVTEEVLPMIEVLSCHDYYDSEIVASGILSFLLELIKHPNQSKHHTVALKILCNLSAHFDLGHHLIYLDFIQHLVPFLDELLLSGYCLKIFRNLCAIDEAASHFLETDRCIRSIGELLEVGKDEEQEHALDIFLSLYYQRDDLHEILMQDSNIFLSLASISTNGSYRGQLLSAELLKLLNNVPDDGSQAYTWTDTSQSTISNPKAKNSNSSSKSSGLFSRIKAKFRKSSR